MEKGAGHLGWVQKCFHFRDATRKAKGHLEVNFARYVKDNKKGFFKYIRKTRGNVAFC